MQVKFKKLFFCVVLFLVGQLVCAQDIMRRKEVELMIKDSKKALIDLDAEKSMRLAQESLSRAFDLNDNALKAKAYMVLGCNFIEFADTKKAKEFFFKSVHYANLAKNDTIKESVYNNIGALYSYYGNDFDKGIIYYKIALTYTEKLKIPIQIIYNSLNIAGAYVDEDRFDEALPFLAKANKYIGRVSEKEALLTYHVLWARYYSHIGEKVKAEQFFKKAITNGKSDVTSLLDSYLAEVYTDYGIHFEKYGDFKSALKYARLSAELKENVYNASRTETVKEGEDKIKIKEYENHISYIERQKEEKELSLQKTYVIIGLFVLIIGVLGAFVYVLLKNNKARKKSYLRLQRINYELEIAKEIAEESTRMKSRFVSTITHELRTPLYGVIGISDILASEYPEIKQSKYLESLKFSAQYLLSLVNDVLQIYKITEKKIVLEKSSFSISEKLDAIKNSFYTQCMKTKNKLEIWVDPRLPQRVLGDRLRFSQIVMNLISNALKFTSEGKVKMEVNLLEEKDKKVWVQFVVTDNGIGIAKENQQKVFEEFVQIERREEDYQGTGLGLPIVKKLVDLFGGEIILESEEGVGTKITFTLIFDIDETVPLVNSFVSNKTTQRIKVLIAEDNKINQMVTERILKAFDFDFVIVGDGAQTIEACKKETFDIILMDINMPVYNGYEATEIIRNLNVTTPIIALTAYDKYEVLDKCKEAGMNNVLVKPFEKQQLLDVINEYVYVNRT